MKKNVIKMKMICVIIFALGFLVNGVVITLYNVDKSSSLSYINDCISETKMYNNMLTQKISENDSLSDYMQKSEVLGYIEENKILYLDKDDAVAEAR